MIKSLIQEQMKKYVGEVSEEELSKSVKNAFRTGLTVLGMIHGAHHIGQQPTANEALTQDQKQAQTRSIASAREDAKKEGMEIYDKHQKSYKNKKIDSFLKAISMNESSGGKNTNHKTMESGIHSGDAAIGRYGLMPNTVKEMANRMGRENPLSIYSKMDNNKISQSIKKNPKHEVQIANFMANHLHDKFGGDESKMAYSWNQGHNLTNDHFQDSHKDYKNHDYVQKYHKNRGSLEKGPIKEPRVDSLASNQ